MDTKYTSEKKKPRDTLFSPKLALIILASILFVISLTYIIFTVFNKCGFPSDRIVSDHALEKSDWLAFWGSILSALCTVILAIVSIKQNKVLKDINNKREDKDTYFEKLRFAAEFYSLLAVNRIIFYANEDSKRSIMIEFCDRGKIAPSYIIFNTFKLKYKINDGDDSKFIEICSFQRELRSVYARKRATGNESDYSVAFDMNVLQFEELTSLFSKNGYTSLLSLFAEIDCKIYNPMKIKTTIQGDLVLRRSEVHTESETSTNTNNIIYEVFDYFVKTMSYEAFSDSNFYVSN